MPRIREYTPETSAFAGAPPSPRATAATFGGGTGSGFGEGLGDVATRMYDVEQRKDVSEAQVLLAQQRAEATVEFQRRAAEAAPGDTSWVQGFKDEFSLKSQKAGEALQTRAGKLAYQTGYNELAAHLTQSAGLWQVHSAGVKAKQDYLATMDANSTTLFHDPSQFQSVLKTTLDSMNDPNGPYAKIPAADREKLRLDTLNQLAGAAVRGEIDKNPTQALKDLENGRWSAFLKDDDRIKELVKEAHQGVTAERAEAARQEILAKKREEEQQEKTKTDFLARLPIYGGDGLSNKEILQSNLKASDKKVFMDLLKKDTETDREQKLYGPGFMDLFSRIHSEDGSPGKIVAEDQLYPEVLNDNITFAGLNALRNEIKGRKTVEGSVEADLKKNFIDLAKSELTGTDPILRLKDPKGELAMQRFMVSFLTTYDAKRKEGKSVADLLNPDSKDYLGTLITPLKRSRAEFMRDIMEANPGGAGGPSVPGAADALPTPASKEEADKLPKGTKYRAPDGSVRVR